MLKIGKLSVNSCGIAVLTTDKAQMQIDSMNAEDCRLGVVQYSSIEELIPLLRGSEYESEIKALKQQIADAPDKKEAIITESTLFKNLAHVANASTIISAILSLVQ